MDKRTNERMNGQMPQIANEPVDLRDRTLIFSRDIIKYAKSIRQDSLSRPIMSQLIRSATSIGANFTEAKDTVSKKDFRNKVLIAKKEASETKYWLKLFREFSDNDELSRLQSECQQIILILQKIITTLGH